MKSIDRKKMRTKNSRITDMYVCAVDGEWGSISYSTVDVSSWNERGTFAELTKKNGPSLVECCDCVVSCAAAEHVVVQRRLDDTRCMAKYFI